MTRTRQRNILWFRPVIETLEDRNLLSMYTVDHLADDSVGAGLNGSLRYCITNAVDGDNIQFGVAGMINLTGALPDLTHSISIDGPGPDQLTVRRDTGGSYRIFEVLSGTTVSLAGLRIANGQLAYASETDGGGIRNGGTLTLSNCTVSGNSANSILMPVARGGGIYNSGTLTVSYSTIAGNFAWAGDDDYPPPDAYAFGGGIYNVGTLTISDSTIAYNAAVAVGYYFSYADGGGILNGLGSTLTVSNSTISNNATQAAGFFSDNAFSGGISNAGTLTVANSTISGNSAMAYQGFSFSWAWGGGIFTSDSGTLAVTNSTVSGNLVIAYPSPNFQRAGGGIWGSFHSQNTIIAGNSATTGPDISGNLGSLGHNLIGNTSGGSGFDPTDLLNVDPMLGALQDNGGPTQTMALLPGSPAIDAGDNTDAPDWDQRGPGFPRIVNGIIDIGAFEVQQDGGNGPGRSLPLHAKSVHRDVSALLPLAISPSPASFSTMCSVNAQPQATLALPQVAVVDRLFAALNQGDAGFSLAETKRVVPVAPGAQEQTATFPVLDGTVIVQLDPARFFDTTIQRTLPEGLN